MNKFYQHRRPQPFHLSVGAVLFNDSLEICVHHFFTKAVPEHLKFLSGGLDDFYLLMRESLEGNESLQGAVLRGLKEEFGATGEIERYLGSLVCDVTTPEHTFQKTTLYHAVRLKKMGERPVVDEESETVLEWHTPQVLIELLKKQAELMGRPELNEIEIIERFMEAYAILSL